MDEYQHLRESADGFQNHAHLIGDRIVPQDHTHAVTDFPTIRPGASAMERSLGIPPNFAVGRLRAAEARRKAGEIRRRSWDRNPFTYYGTRAMGRFVPRP